MLLGTVINITNDAKEYIFQRLLYCLVLSPYYCVLGVDSLSGRNLDGSASDRRMRNWVGRGDKRENLYGVVDDGGYG